MAVSKVSIKAQLLLMDQIPVKTHKSNYDDKIAQFNLEAVKIIKFSPARCVLALFLTPGD